MTLILQSIVEKTVKSAPKVLDCTKPLVCRFDADGPVIKTTVWTANVAENFVACGHIRKQLVAEFKANGITIPYQTVTITKD